MLGHKHVSVSRTATVGGPLKITIQRNTVIAVRETEAGESGGRFICLFFNQPSTFTSFHFKLAIINISSFCWGGSTTLPFKT